MFRAFAGCVGFDSKLDILLVRFSPSKAGMSDFPAADTAAFSSLFSKLFFGKLPEVTFSDACKDLVGGNIALDTLESYPFRQDCLYVCNKFCSLFVRNSFIFPCFPEPVQRSTFSHKSRINLEIIGPEARVLKELFKTSKVQF